MDTTCQVRQQYGDALQRLARIASQLSSARGQSKRKFENQLNQQSKDLLIRIQQDWPSRSSQNFVLKTLYQETDVISGAVANAIRAAWQQTIIQQQMQDTLGKQVEEWNVSGLLNACAKPAPDLSILPSGSWFLRFDFTLAKPYISHDDEPNYLIDNPLTKDRVFGLPMIRPSSWKGNLRSALRLHNRLENDDTPEMIRLFGNPKGTESDFRAGRLEFYPTFFYRIGLEIINPHDRTRKVGKNPILMECVPASARGAFSLLYVPFDLIGTDAKEMRAQAAQDLAATCEAIEAMMLTYGFSAKRTSGYGMAQEKVSDGFFQIRMEDASPSSPGGPSSTELQLPKYLQAPGKLKDEYLTPEGTFRERSQAELGKMTKAQRQEYEKAKKWWEREGKALAEQPPAPTEPSPPPAPQWLRREFDSFEQLRAKVKEVAQSLQSGGAS